MTTKYTKLIVIIQSIINRRKEKLRRQKVADLKSRFAVMERHGALWLTLDGVAFKEVPANTPVSEVTSLLVEARIAAAVFASRQ